MESFGCGEEGAVKQETIEAGARLQRSLFVRVASACIRPQPAFRQRHKRASLDASRDLPSLAVDTGLTRHWLSLHKNHPHKPESILSEVWGLPTTHK